MTPRSPNLIPPENVQEVLAKATENREHFERKAREQHKEDPERFEEGVWLTERNFPVEDLSHLDLPEWEIAEGPVLWDRRYVWPSRCLQCSRWYYRRHSVVMKNLDSQGCRSCVSEPPPLPEK